MSNQIQMQKTWEDLHTQSRFRPKYPNELVVRWALTQFQDIQKPKVLDLGCGGGRHSIFLAQENFDVYASDISRKGVAATKAWAESLKLDIKIDANPAHLIEYPDNFFDGVLCFAVLYYGTKTEMEMAINKIYKNLKPGGKFFFITRGNEDWRVQYGQLVKPFEYQLTQLGHGTPSDCELGMIETFLDQNELRSMLKDFNQISIDRSHLSWANGQFLDHDWVISAVK